MPKTAKKKATSGRPPMYEITPTLLGKIEKLAELGCLRHEIASLVDMPRRSWNRWQRDERIKDALARGKAHRSQVLRQAQWDAATEDRNPTMLIWLGKQYLDQREPPQRVQQDVSMSGDVTQMSREQLHAIIRRAEAPGDKNTPTEH